MSKLVAFSRVSTLILKTLGRGDFESIKLINEWLPTLLQDHSPLNDEIPWLTLKAIKWLEKNLKPNMTVFEYGSGGSTIFIAKRVSKIVSVEHDSFWYNKVLEVMKEKSIYNCKYILLEPDEGDFKSEYGYKSILLRKENIEIKILGNMFNQLIDLKIILMSF